MITIIDYNAGNTASCANALGRLGQEFEITSDSAKIRRASKVIFPGVGAAASAMKSLSELGLIEVIRNLEVPFLGICLGMQILADYSEEGGVECLGILPGTVKKFESKDLKVPQIGWNKVRAARDSALTDGVKDGSYFYFVNSYYFEPSEDLCVGQTLYDVNFCSIAQKDSFYATQFHPEKSGEQGLKLLDNFCRL